MANNFPFCLCKLASAYFCYVSCPDLTPTAPQQLAPLDELLETGPRDARRFQVARAQQAELSGELQQFGGVILCHAAIITQCIQMITSEYIM